MATIVQSEEYGPPEVLTAAASPDPVPGRGEVRIAVRAAGVQPFDCATRRGDFRDWRPIPLPARLGNEVAGVIDAVGEGADARLGDP